MRTVLAIAAVSMILAASVAQAAALADLEPYTFLLGKWPSVGSGQPGQGSGAAEFTLSLQDRVIMRSSHAEYPATSDKPKSRHDDFMIIYATSPAHVRADYYDSEGHLIHYVASAPAPGEAVFVSEPAPGEPIFRLSYKLDAGVLKGKFEMAAPNAPGDFKPYLSWESHKEGKPGK